MDLKIFKFGEVLANVRIFSHRCWVYLPKNKRWSLESDAAVLESNEVPLEEEDAPESGEPAFAQDHDLMRALPVGEIQSIIHNAKLQRPNATNEDIFEAFLHYYDNDAYIRW